MKYLLLSLSLLSSIVGHTSETCSKMYTISDWNPLWSYIGENKINVEHVEVDYSDEIE